MSLIFRAFWLLFYLHSVVVGEELAQPQDVTLITMNTNYMLSWVWHQHSAHSQAVTFTTQYVGKYKLLYKKRSPSWSTVCNETPQKSCDLTAVGLHYLGMYMIRVRANMKEHHSDWVQKEFCPDKDAALGPPIKVNLATDGSNIEIAISEPVTSTNITMRSYIPTLRYHVVYWERSANIETKMLTTANYLVYLSDLKAWTWYCVSVQSRYDFYNKSSIFTKPQCIQTDGNIPWWQVFLYFLASLAICFLVVLLSVYMSCWCYRTIKATFYPSDQLPLHLKKYLCRSPGSDVPGLLNPDPECELLCKQVTISAIPTVLEIFSSPPEALLEQRSSLGPESRESHQKSSTSGDSGVFSTDGSSRSSQLCTGFKDFVKTPFDLEQGDNVVHYDTYVQVLRNDLADAIRIAKDYASRQPQQQANLYNRKWKENPVEVGSRVLLANKGEQRKRKSADRWDNNVYMVVDKHVNTHTFKIRNCTTKQEKVVHRNLIMPIKVLPMPDMPWISDSCVSDLAVMDTNDSLSDMDCVSHLSLPSENRTASWISQLPDLTVGHEPAVADTPET